MTDGHNTEDHMGSKQVPLPWLEGWCSVHVGCLPCIYLFVYFHITALPYALFEIWQASHEYQNSTCFHMSIAYDKLHLTIITVSCIPWKVQLSICTYLFVAGGFTPGMGGFPPGMMGRGGFRPRYVPIVQLCLSCDLMQTTYNTYELWSCKQYHCVHYRGGHRGRGRKIVNYHDLDAPEEMYWRI